LAAALAAAEEAGQLVRCCAEWTENQLATQSRSRQLAQTLAYPTICVILSVTLLTFRLVPDAGI
jgi:type II secretory pathway component PulF